MSGLRWVRPVPPAQTPRFVIDYENQLDVDGGGGCPEQQFCRTLADAAAWVVENRAHLARWHVQVITAGVQRATDGHWFIETWDIDDSGKVSVAAGRGRRDLNEAEVLDMLR